MEDEIVSLETAMLLKEKGFNEPCCHFYENNELHELNYYQGNGAGFVRNNSQINDMMYCEEMQCTAPTQSLAKKWLRETRNITFNANPHSNDGKIIYVVTIKVISSNKYIDFNVMMDTSNKAIMFDTYEDAIESGLKHCLKSI